MNSIVWTGWSGSPDPDPLHRQRDRDIQTPGFVARTLIPLLESLYVRGHRAVMWHTPQGTVTNRKVDVRVWSALPDWLRAELRSELAEYLVRRWDLRLGVYAYTPATQWQLSHEYYPWAKLGVRMFGWDECTVARGLELAPVVRRRWPGTRLVGEGVPITPEGLLQPGVEDPAMEWAGYYWFFCADPAYGARITQQHAAGTVHLICRTAEEVVAGWAWEPRGYVTDPWSHVVPAAAVDGG